MTDERLVREQSFHDTRFAAGERPADRFYAINRASDAFFRARIDELPAGTTMLDYGCGEGAFAAIHAARRGLAVTAIDLSPVAIELARARAREAGVDGLIEFRVMNAEQLDVPDRSFGFVCGLGVLHHLDLGAALGEITRVMRPDAAAAFVEPLGHNPLINLYRRGTPTQRTVDEHPLLMEDLAAISRRFAVCEASFFHLLGLLAFPLRRRRHFDSALTALDRLDAPLLRTPARRFAWMVGLRVAQPVV